MRAPEAPTGWPSARAPPLTLTISGSTPRMRVEWIATPANASFISTRSRSSALHPAFSSASFPALPGTVSRFGGSSATLACATMVPRGSRFLPLGEALAREHEGPGPVRDAGRVAGGHGAALVYRLRAASFSRVVSCRYRLVGVDVGGLSLLAGNLYADYLFGEFSVVGLRRRRAGGCGAPTRPALRGRCRTSWRRRCRSGSC